VVLALQVAADRGELSALLVAEIELLQGLDSADDTGQHHQSNNSNNDFLLHIEFVRFLYMPANYFAL